MCSGVNVWDFNCSQHNFFPLAVSAADQDTDSLPRLCVWYVCVCVCVVPGDVQAAENSIPGDVSSTKQRLLKITIAPPSFILFFFPPPHLYSAAVSAAVLMLFSPVSFFSFPTCHLSVF